MRRLLGGAWHPDIPVTLHEVLTDARQRFGVVGGCVVALAEMIDLAKVAASERLGHKTPITGGAAPPSPSSKNSWSARSMIDDLRNGWIRIVRHPRAAAGVVALMALAIGVTSAMFSIVDAFLLSPAPFRNADTLHRVGALVPRGGKPLSDAEMLRILRDERVFDTVFATGLNAPGEIEGPTGIKMQRGSWVPPGVFAELGVRPLLGREFQPGEGAEGNSAQVLLSEQVWRDQFNADPAVVGSTIRVSNEPVLVVGVMPAHLRFPIRGEGIWRPYDADRPSAAAMRTQLLLFARRPASMPVAAANERASAALRSATGIDYTVDLGSPSSGLLDAYSRESIVTLAIGVGLLFLLLCLNVTNLILARTAGRQVEFGVCSALGASRGRLMRQAFFENVALGIAGAVAGLALAIVLVQLAANWLPADLEWRTLNPLDVDLRVVMATSAFGVLATVLAGVPAAWLGTRGDVNRTLQISTRSGSGHRTASRTSTVLLIGEMAIAVALLAAAGLQVRSFVNLTNADRGVDASRVQVASLTMPERLFPDPAARATIVETLESRLAALPGVERTTYAQGIPPQGGSIHFSYRITSDIPDFTPVEVPFMFGYSVSSGFLGTLGIQVLAGRDFRDDDSADTAVISQSLARAVFGDADPVGRAFTFSKTTYRIVGVAEEIRNTLTDPRQDYPELYTHRSPVAPRAPSSVAIAIRCADPCASQASLREVLSTAQAGVELRSLAPLSDSFMAQLSRPQTATTVASGFAMLALIATAVGLFGIMSQSVTRRRREFGIRAAVGAAPDQLRRLVLAGALRVCGVGLVMGVGAGWALGRWLESVQYGVSFFDPLTWVSVGLLVSVVSIIACWVPARRAMTTDPVSLLRES